MTTYPGTTQHQALLQAIVAHYAQDARVRAVIVFGSLGRGTWDAYSDIDLDVVIADDTRIDAIEELRRLCESFSVMNEKAAIIIPDDDDAGDVVLESLMQLSVRYHTLNQTHPNIVESMRVLAGPLEHAAIAAAGEANHKSVRPPICQLLDRCIRDAAVVTVCLQRKRIWLAVEMLHHARNHLMQMFADAHSGQRAHQTFESEADALLQARLGATLPQYDLRSLQNSLEHVFDILENDLEVWTDGQVQLTHAHKTVLHQLRQSNVAIQAGAS